MAKIDTCVFCGYHGRDFDPEHWVPDWLSREVIPRHGEKIIHNHPGRPSWPSNRFDLTVRHVCKTCNGGWMSDLEGRAKPHVLPFILGRRPDPITQDGMLLVARWAYLKVISLELGRPKEHRPTHPTSVYAAFKTKQRPPHPSCSLALGVRDIGEEHPIFLWWQSQGLRFTAGSPDAPDLDGYHTTLLIGHLVIDVLGTIAPVKLNVEHGEGFHVLWPTLVNGGTFSWPPKHRFQGVENDRLV